MGSLDLTFIRVSNGFQADLDLKFFMSLKDSGFQDKDIMDVLSNDDNYVIAHSSFIKMEQLIWPIDR